MKSRYAESLSQLPNPDTFDHARFKECLRTAHDLGGQFDGPIVLQERKPKRWEVSTFVTCECLAWRGVWNNVEKLRRHSDLGQKQYLELPYYGRWLLAAARALVDKEHVTLTELLDKIEAVRKRYEQKSSE